MTSAAGYPKEEILLVHEPKVLARLTELSKKDLTKVAKRLPLVFDDLKVRRAGTGTHVVVARDDFERQFHAFTSGIFADWEPSLWSNVLVAGAPIYTACLTFGGAVLATLLPIDPNFARLKPLEVEDKWGDRAEWDFFDKRRQFIGPNEPKRTYEQYFSTTLWPHSDIDLFVYGMTEAEAQKKLLTILTKLRRSLLLATGARHEVYFVKTANTITVTESSSNLAQAGRVVRNIQIITRLYASRDDILNGFDIDCCCCGFDGEHALITPRAIAAITTRVNTVDLSIRGESYELRLLKYVERGFAIGVPRLVRTAIDREHLSFKFGEHPWWGGISIDSSEGWRRWTFATGLELLLMAEQLARGFEGDGEVPWPLPGRRRSAKVHHDDPNLKFQLQPFPPVRDNYPPGRDASGDKIWPATTHLDAIKHGEGEWAIKWLEGNMPRKPQSWEEWSAAAMRGAERKSADTWRQHQKEREVEAQQKKAEAAQKQKREDRHWADELVQARAEAANSAEMQRTAAETAAAQAKAQVKLQSAVIEELRKAAEAGARAKQLATEELTSKVEASERLASATADDDSKLCSVCLDQDKCVMLEPCRHVCLCQECAPMQTSCPICRVTPTNRVLLYL